MTTKQKLLALILVLGIGCPCVSQVRNQKWNTEWKFMLGECPAAEQSDFDDSTWRKLDLPHDWSIEGKSDEKNPSGNDGGYFPTGIGWYRKTFVLPKSAADKKIGIYFEGVYMNSEVYINGQKLGFRPYGYSSFFYDMTPYLNHDGQKNTLAVKVDNSQQKNCRWYSGSGIYRNVWLVTTNQIHFVHQCMAVSTKLEDDKALVSVSVQVCNDTETSEQVSLSANLTYAGKQITQTEQKIELLPHKSAQYELTLQVNEPAMWSPDSPNLYGLAVDIANKDKMLDRQTEKIGIRTIAYSVEKGLELNGEKILLNGGCLHHDNGCLGAAAYDKAEIRKAELLKAAGFNAVRTSHNIPAEAFLYACDSLGLLVIDEAFDGWRTAKTKYDYAAVFDKWWQRDVESMVLRDRNHPSIFCWSIGNEVIERKQIAVVTTAHKLAELVHKLDATRPVTSALTTWDKEWEIFDPLAAEHDIVGYNYQLHHAVADHKRVPERIIMQTESYPREAFANWKLVHDHDYIIGDFVWTAMDYLGESGIGRYFYKGESEGEHYHRNQYPWHGAYCGDIDLTGWRKPISHYREMLYSSEKTLYMAVKEPDGYYGKIKETLWSVWPTWESWTWPNHEGKNIQVEVISNYQSVKLYLNDKLVGEQPTTRAEQFKAVFDVEYTAGVLRAVAVEDGVEVKTVTLATTGNPYGIRLTPSNLKMSATGDDLCFVVAEIVDGKGNVVPNADNSIDFDLKGCGSVIATGSASLQDTIPYTEQQRKAWKGRAIAVVKSNMTEGKITLTASSKGLKSATIKLSNKK